MGCPCSKAGATSNVAEASYPNKTFRAPGERMDCYLTRAGDGGTAEGGGEIEIDKIANNTITVDCALKIDITFVLTEGSLSETDPIDPAWQNPLTWSIELTNDDEPPVAVQLSDLGLTFDTNSGKLSGTLPDSVQGNVYHARVKANAMNKGSNSVDVVDDKGYVFSGKKCDKSDLKFVRPLPGNSVVTGHFGDDRGDHKHGGIDLAYGGSQVGDVVAAADGTVKNVYPDGTVSGYGNCVEIAHFDAGGDLLITTFYAHLESFTVSAGQHVGAGTVIGREGNTGRNMGGNGGKHLHFEVRIKGTTKTDPLPYIDGTTQVDVAASTDPDNPSGQTTPVTNSNTALTTAQIKAQSKCPEAAPVSDSSFSGKNASASQAVHGGKCRPNPSPTKDETVAALKKALDELGITDQFTRNYFYSMVQIESTWDQYASNNTSSALGPYQMLNDTAATFYGRIGVEPTCENRCNMEYATQAQYEFYKDQLSYYNKWKATGKIAGKVPPDNSHTARYSTISKGAWLYGLIHHDGVGNAANGKNLQGVDYWNSHAPWDGDSTTVLI